MRKLTKSKSRELSETIENDALLLMLKLARFGVPDWSVPSRCNKGISRGKLWNMFCSDFDSESVHTPVVIYRILEEFGEYLPENMKQPVKVTREYRTYHEEPNFNKFK